LGSADGLRPFRQSLAFRLWRARNLDQGQEAQQNEHAADKVAVLTKRGRATAIVMLTMNNLPYCELRSLMIALL